MKSAQISLNSDKEKFALDRIKNSPLRVNSSLSSLDSEEIKPWVTEKDAPSNS